MHKYCSVDPITLRSNVFPVLVLFTERLDASKFAVNGRNKMNSLEVKERVTWLGVGRGTCYGWQ
jgi:hypothetical protein